MLLDLAKQIWATFWANVSQKHPVTLDGRKAAQLFLSRTKNGSMPDVRKRLSETDLIDY
jgi:hypothetical protein